MAQKTVVTLIDDLTGEESGDISTVEFALDGVTYEIDLGKKNADELRDTLEVYIECGRRVGGRAKRGTAKVSSSKGASREHNTAVREWAKQHGYELSDRGRIPGHVAEAFDKAHQGAAA